MNTLGERMLEVMRELNIDSPKDLAVFCGVTEGLVSQWFSGMTKLGPKPLKALSKTHFNLEWITEGSLPKYRKDGASQHLQVVQAEDPPDVVTADEIIELVTAYKTARKKDRQSVMDSAKTAAERASTLRGAVEVDKG